MGIDIKVSLEAFGDRRLTVSIPEEKVKGKSFQEIIDYIVNQNWTGEDKQTLAIVNRELGASGGYTPSIQMGGENLPFKAQPVRLGENIERYIEDGGQAERQLTVSVTGVHKVGHLSYRI